MDTPALLPCPFCGGRACLDDSVGGAFVSCELCEAQGPFIELEQAVTNAVSTTTTATLTFADAHGITVGKRIAVKDLPAPFTTFNGSFVVTAMTTTAPHVDYPESMLLKKQAIQKAQAAAAAAAAWNQRSAWQPIETAPGGETEILAWDGEEMYVAYFWLVGFLKGSVDLHSLCSHEDKVMYCCPSDGSDFFVYPTHWQPLPSPPPITP